MSKIYEYENQMIIRFPQQIADKIREKFDKNEQMPLNIQPKLGQTLEFEVDIPELNFKENAYMVELPTITESYKTRDYINFFKSNDINQMIWVGQPINSRLVNTETDKKIVYDSGLTPPTYNIRKDFFRKQPEIPVEDIQRVEAELKKIQEEQQPSLGEYDDEEEPQRRRKSRFRQ